MTKTEIRSKILKDYINHTCCATDLDIAIIRVMIEDLELAQYMDRTEEGKNG